MRIKSQNAKEAPSEKADGNKKFEFTMDLKTVKALNGKNISEKIFLAAQETANDFLANSYFAVAKLVTELEHSDDPKAKSYVACLESSESCTYVYWGCGSCGGNSARVDAYCGSGGSQPDYSWCERC